jgi:hypothetical protein
VPEILYRDCFPVETYAAHVHGAPMHPTRVFVTSERVQVWKEVDRQPVLLAESKVTGTPVERDRGTLTGQLKVETVDGPVYVTKGRGCGCGSVLLALARPCDW